jgi:hypothetical protein
MSRAVHNAGPDAVFVVGMGALPAQPIRSLVDADSVEGGEQPVRLLGILPTGD